MAALVPSQSWHVGALPARRLCLNAPEPSAWPRSRASASSSAEPFAGGTAHRAARVLACVTVVAAARGRRRGAFAAQPGPRKWRTPQELTALVGKMDLKPKQRFRDPHGRVPVGAPGSASPEAIEAFIDEFDPDPRASRADQFDPRKDDPLTKGIDIMVMKSNALHHMIQCQACGIPLQVHNPDTVGYVPLDQYLRKWARGERRKITCTRCEQLAEGKLRPVVKETLGLPVAPAATEKEEEAGKLDTEETPKPQVRKEDLEALGFGTHVVPAADLKRQLITIRKRRCLVVYIIDVLDFNGSFLRNLRDITGKNGIVAIGTKTDLLPPDTNLSVMEEWVRYSLTKKRLSVLDVVMVSNLTGQGIALASKVIWQRRRGMDVFVVGTANAGKSMFIGQLLEKLQERFPGGLLERVPRPLVSKTPGTTLGTMPLRAFRRSATARTFSCIYDTPGVHQPKSMQNLIHIQKYNQVQPTRAFDVVNVYPAKDVLALLKKSGELVNQANTKAWLSRPVRYTWGFPGEEPVAAIEVVPPVMPSLVLSFVGVNNLRVDRESVTTNDNRGEGLPDGIGLAQIAFVKLPEVCRLEGDALCDLAISGFGHVTVSVVAVSAAASGRALGRSTTSIRIFGPKKVRVNINKDPMPVAGIPARIPERFLEQQQQEQEERAAPRKRLIRPQESLDRSARRTSTFLEKVEDQRDTFDEDEYQPSYDDDFLTGIAYRRDDDTDPDMDPTRRQRHPSTMPSKPTGPKQLPTGPGMDEKSWYSPPRGKAAEEGNKKHGKPRRKPSAPAGVRGTVGRGSGAAGGGANAGMVRRLS